MNQAEQELRELLPMTHDLNNRVFKMLDRPFLHTEATVQTKPMEVKVKITRNGMCVLCVTRNECCCCMTDTKESITMQKTTFLTQRTILLEQVAQLTNAVGAGHEWKMEHEETNDPVNLFFDTEFDAGHANSFTMSLGYNLGTEDDDGILVINRAVPLVDEIGKLDISWEPCVAEEVDGVWRKKAGAEPDMIDEPDELIGKEWAVELKIKKVHKLPFMVTKCYVSYEFYNEAPDQTLTQEYEEGQFE